MGQPQLPVELLIHILDLYMEPTLTSALAWTEADIGFMRSLRLVSRAFYDVAMRQMHIRTLIETPTTLDRLVVQPYLNRTVRSLAIVRIRKDQLSALLQLIEAVAPNMVRLMLALPDHMCHNEYIPFCEGLRPVFHNIQEFVGIRTTPIFVHLFQDDAFRALAKTSPAGSPKLWSLLLDDELVDAKFCKMLMEELPALERLALVRPYVTTTNAFMTAVASKPLLREVLITFTGGRLMGASALTEGTSLHPVPPQCIRVVNHSNAFGKNMVPWCIQGNLTGDVWDFGRERLQNADDGVELSA